MSDNIAISPGTGASVATDDVGGVHYQRVKLVDGTLDSAAAIPGDATNGLDVDVTRVQGTVAVSGPLTDAELRATPVAVSASSLPLGTGAATAANQTTANASLAALETKIGEVQATPTANTVLDRLKALLTGTVLAAGSAVIGKVGIDQTTPGTTNAVKATNLPTTVATNAGVTDASTIRVITASDGPLNTAIGATADAAVSTDAAGSINAHLRGLVKLLAGALFDATNQLRVSLYGKSVAAGDTPLLVDSNGRQIVVGAAADGAPAAGPPVLVAGMDGSSNAQTLTVDSAARLAIYGYAASPGTDSTANGSMGWANVPGSGSVPLAAQVLFNGTTWDRGRGNVDATALASAARTATTNSADLTNYNHRGIALIVNVTARGGATTLTPYLQVKDSISGNYFTIWTAAAAINSAAGTFAYLFYPGAAGAGSWTEKLETALAARTFRVGLTHSDASSITYSVSANMLV